MANSTLTLNFHSGGSQDLDYGNENAIAIELNALDVRGSEVAKLVSEEAPDEDIESIVLNANENVESVSVRIYHRQGEEDESQIDGTFQMHDGSETLKHTIGRFDSPGWRLPITIKKQG